MGFFDALLQPRNVIDHGDFEFGPALFPGETAAGQNVNADTAMNLVAVYACVTLIADAIRALPVDVFRKTQDRREPVARPPAWLTQPNRHQTWGQFIDYGLHSILTHGNTYVGVGSRDLLGFPAEFNILHPDDVQVQVQNGRKLFTVDGEEFTPYTSRTPDGQILHIPGHTADGITGLSPIDQAKQAIGAGLAVEEFGNRYYSNGAVTSGTIELPQGSVPDPDQLKLLSAEFRRKHTGKKNAWKPIVLANGATFKPMTVPNDQAQFIETRKFSVAEIARLYRVPPHLIGDLERSTSWGTGIEQQGIGFVQYTLNPWLTRFEEAFSQALPRGQHLKFNVNALLRGDAQSRKEYLIGMTQGQLMTVNEARQLEDLPPFEDGDNPPPPPNASV